MTDFEGLYSIPFVTKPFGIVEVTGPFGVGKTLFALTTGAEMSRICVLDCEGSAEQYKSWGFDWYDIIGLAAGNGLTVSAEQVYLAAAKIASQIPANRYDVIVVENLSRIEDGLVDYVTRHPAQFGLSRAQVEKGGGLIWGPIKTLEQNFLLGLKARAKMVIVTVHLRQVWAGKRPVPGLYKPKGKDVLRMLSTLSIWLRFSDSLIPSGLVLKARMAKIENGIPKPVLPPKLPKATWEAIRGYMHNPFDPAHPKPGEVPTAQEWHILRGTLSKEQRDLILALMQSKDDEGEEVNKIAVEESKPKMTAQEFIQELSRMGISLNDALKRLGANNLAEVDYGEAIEKLRM